MNQLPREEFIQKSVTASAFVRTAHKIRTAKTNRRCAGNREQTAVEFVLMGKGTFFIKSVAPRCTVDKKGLRSEKLHEFDA
jgi:hypothetical protein